MEKNLRTGIILPLVRRTQNSGRHQDGGSASLPPRSYGGTISDAAGWDHRGWASSTHRTVYPPPAPATKQGQRWSCSPPGHWQRWPHPAASAAPGRGCYPRAGPETRRWRGRRRCRSTGRASWLMSWVSLSCIASYSGMCIWDEQDQPVPACIYSPRAWVFLWRGWATIGWRWKLAWSLLSTVRFN